MDSPHRARAMLSFVQAAHTGSFAAAGRALGITSAAVSKNVAGLEKALGVRLMNRTTRSLRLTREGGAFLQHASVALEALDAAFDAVSAERIEPSGNIRISTSTAFGREQVMPVVPGLLAKYPGLAVEIDFDDRVIDLVRDGYDLAIRGGHIPDSSLITRPVCRLNTILAASPAYLASHGVPRTPADLGKHRLIARRFLGGRVAPWNFKAAKGAINTMDPSSGAALILSAPESLVHAACHDVGIAEVGVHLAWPHLVSGALQVVLHRAHHPGDYVMVMQYPHRALVAPRVRATVDYLLQAFADAPELHLPLSRLATYAAVP